MLMSVLRLVLLFVEIDYLILVLVSLFCTVVGFTVGGSLSCMYTCDGGGDDRHTVQ